MKRFSVILFMYFLNGAICMAETKADWPSPVMDTETFSLAIFDLLEYQNTENSGSLNWDFVAWRGGDVHRIWLKSEGNYKSSNPQVGEADFQLLYGKLVMSFFDAQIGARVEQTLGNQRNSRVSAAISIQGLVPYIFETEAAIFVGSSGHLAGRFSASKDFRFTQKAIVQTRFETNASAKKSDEFETGSGINDIDLGLRLRYELKREIAPYLGVAWTNTFGETAEYKRLSGGKVSELKTICGLRLWF